MAVCEVCPRGCDLKEGQTGFCRARACLNGKVESINYGKITSIALDPIEKKPLYHFYPKSMILSVGSFGCNLRCPFCQNHRISMAGTDEVPCLEMTPEELVEKALMLKDMCAGNLGVAFTYNEPFIGFEFVRDTAVLLNQANLKTVLVTNGFVSLKCLEELLPLTDAMNIDLKGFSQSYYDYVGGKLEDVKRTIERAAQKCHVELTTLIVPTKNDSIADMERQAKWIASISDEIPLHISRYFPCYQSTVPATPVETIYSLCDAAKKHLKYVYAGNCG